MTEPLDRATVLRLWQAGFLDFQTVELLQTALMLSDPHDGAASHPRPADRRDGDDRDGEVTWTPPKCSGSSTT
jgi:hypothetical protein